MAAFDPERRQPGRFPLPNEATSKNKRISRGYAVSCCGLPVGASGPYPCSPSPQSIKQDSKQIINRSQSCTEYATEFHRVEFLALRADNRSTDANALCAAPFASSL